MVGRERTVTLSDAGQPIRISGPRIDVNRMANAEPDSIGVMSHLLGQPKLAFQERTATTRIHYPASLDLTVAVIILYLQMMKVALRLQENLLDFATVQKGNSLAWKCVA